MAYTPFDMTKPDGTVQTPSQMGQSMLDNMKALLHMVSSGSMIGWQGVATPGADNLRISVYTLTYAANSQLRLRKNYTWAGYRVSTIQYQYSSNGGGAWDTIGTRTFSWNGDGTYASDTWS